LCASLLKIKSVAAAPNLPAELKAGPPKPEISEEERSLLHNVTSALYNRKEVRTALDKAVSAICGTLGVEVPPKKGKGGKDQKEKEEQPADRGNAPREEVKSADMKEKKKTAKEAVPASEDIPDEEVEDAIAKYEALLGGSDEEDSGSEGDDEEDPMQITSDEGEEDDGFGDIDLDSEDGGEVNDESSFAGFSSDEGEPAIGQGGSSLRDDASSEEDDSDDAVKEAAKPRDSSDDEEDDDEDEDEDDEEYDSDHSSAISRSPSPKRASKRRKAVEDTGPTTGSTFLPSLMGGYISGSESASDVDIAPPRKNRRGQRARQAIWEKKFKEEAKHLHKPQRDQGWDPKRGAVEGARTPWKRGIANPFGKSADGGAGGKGGAAGAPEPPKKPRIADNTGPLHPSWEAKKRVEEKLQNVKFEGKKIKFD
jgi:hypothetical protein